MRFKNNILQSQILGALLVVSIFTAGCVSNGSNSGNNNVAASGNETSAASNSNAGTDSPDISTTGNPEENMSPEEIERGRSDTGWKQYVKMDASDESSSPNKESLEEVMPEKMNTVKMHLPLNDGKGPSVFQAQLLLDRSPYSPGILDGAWGKNTEKAVYWMQKSEGLKATGTINQETFKRLYELAGTPDKMIVEHKLTEKDVSGPFIKIPGDIYEQAKLDCMCYESLKEKLGEMFHIDPELLQRLNPKVKLDELKAGDTIYVPNLQNPFREGETKTGGTTSAKVEKLIVSDGGHYVHAVDKDGKIIYHFPSTLGSTYAPSPSGDWKVNVVAPDPAWHYQPALLTGEPDNKPDAMIPAGPNNPVGVVWIDLTKEHYGIHGTAAPATIGYATSHGCVRLTNWDAAFLGKKVEKGTLVTFTDTQKKDTSGGNSNSE